MGPGRGGNPNGVRAPAGIRPRRPVYNRWMNTPLPIVRLKNAWRSSHPWIFQKLVEKPTIGRRSEEHTSELQSQSNLVCRLLLEKKKKSEEKPTDSYRHER